jgi:hypothetical protein
MNKMVALLVVVVCLAGLAVAISLVLRRADSPSADNRVNPDAVDAQKRRVVERMTSNEPHGSVQVTTNVGVSIDLERDWAEYRKSPEGGVALQSIVRGAAQPNVSSDARIKLVQGILAFDDISEEEQEKRIKANL